MPLVRISFSRVRQRFSRKIIACRVVELVSHRDVSRLCKSREEDREDSLPRFWLLFAVERKMLRTNRRRWAKRQGQCSTCQDWRSTMAKEKRGETGLNRTCCFPFASRKSSLWSWMNGIISLRGKLRRVTDRDPLFSCIFSLDF